MRYGPENVPVSELPKTLFPTGVSALLNHNPAELDMLAARPQKLKEMPAHWSESKKRQMSGMAQYGGRSPDGQRRALGNLPRRFKMENLQPIDTGTPIAPTVPEGTIIPVPPTMMPKVPSNMTITGKYQRRVVAQDEAKLFEETYKQWISDHPEWTSAEDLDDLQTICMETVLMFRLLCVEKQTPSENLMARRRDKMDAKRSDPNSKNINVAVLAGEMSPERLAAKKLKSQETEQAEELDFLNGTREGENK